ncbi:MAG: hypothetical protein NXH85_01915 [Pseudomonadaceae bacterium]|nr:hypothetical protein [Pseudomonadaceae bacterium]
MTTGQLNQQATLHSDDEDLTFTDSPHSTRAIESCARVNAWQQVIERRASQPLLFRW